MISWTFRLPHLPFDNLFSSQCIKQSSLALILMPITLFKKKTGHPTVFGHLKICWPAFPRVMQLGLSEIPKLSWNTKKRFLEIGKELGLHFKTPSRRVFSNKNQNKENWVKEDQTHPNHSPLGVTIVARLVASSANDGNRTLLHLYSWHRPWEIWLGPNSEHATKNE